MRRVQAIRAVQIRDYWQRRLLRARAKRPSGCRTAAEQRYKVSPPHAEHGAPSQGCRHRSYQLGTAGRRRSDASGACPGKGQPVLGADLNRSESRCCCGTPEGPCPSWVDTVERILRFHDHEQIRNCSSRVTVPPPFSPTPSRHPSSSEIAPWHSLGSPLHGGVLTRDCSAYTLTEQPGKCGCDRRPLGAR